jgi:heme exporter protein A
MPVSLTVTDLSTARGERVIFSGISFALKSGEALLLTGANGAGKTTLLRTLAGFLPAASGTITLHGGAEEQMVGEACHYVGHLNGIKPAFTVKENLHFWSDYFGGEGESRDRVARALKTFDLEPLAAIPCAYLSAGQKRRAGLARLIAADRPIWLLDEPTASLDTANSALLTSAINAHTAAGGIVIAATHLPLGLERARELKLGREAVPA